MEPSNFQIEIRIEIADFFYLQECTNVFSKGGGEALAKTCDVPFLGNSTFKILLEWSLFSGDNFWIGTSVP